MENETGIIEQKIAEYRKAAINYGQLAAANHGAAEALEWLLSLRASPPVASEEDDGEHNDG